jgi:LmbE family N-acetylglucosaminyl deacetylase
MDASLRVLVIGAHPDDADICCGGLALKYSSQGHIVKFVSCTNGATGHFNIGGIELARRRYAEAQESATIANLSEYQILDWHTGELEPTVVNRKVIIKIIRDFKPDLIITHRPNDYHPDHRYTSQLVQDASYIITVPNMLPLTDIVTKTPVICYVYDEFQKPYPFRPDVVVSIDDVIDKKISMLHCHESQMYEWIPYNNGILDQVPADDDDRRKLLEEQYDPVWRNIADLYRERLIKLYGPEKGRAIKYAEAYEICEYGSALPNEEIFRLFPFN